MNKLVFSTDFGCGKVVGYNRGGVYIVTFRNKERIPMRSTDFLWLDGCRGKCDYGAI